MDVKERIARLGKSLNKLSLEEERHFLEARLNRIGIRALLEHAEDALFKPIKKFKKWDGLSVLLKKKVKKK